MSVWYDISDHIVTHHTTVFRRINALGVEAENELSTLSDLNENLKMIGSVVLEI